MLSFMRRHARSWFIKVLLGTVILVFIFFYGFNLRQRRANLVASVNGVKIDIQAFQSQYQNILKAQPTQGNLTAEQLRALKEAALESIIDRILLLDQARKWRFTVTDEELREYIHRMPAFQENGHFSYERFVQFLRFQGMAEEDFLDEVRRSLLLQKVEAFIKDAASVDDEEVIAIQEMFNERVILRYVEWKPEAFLKKVKVTDEELARFFQEHRESYKIPEKVRVSYLRFSPAIYRDEVQIAEEEIRQRYNETQDRWRVSKQVLGRHILFRVKEEDDPKVRMKILQKAEEVLKRLKAGEPFEKLAKEYSEDPETASKGGLLGWKKREELPEPLAKAFFEDLTPGQLSDPPVKSPLGFHILKLDEVRAERVRPLEEVRETIERELREEKSRQRALEVAEQAYLAIFQGASFQEAAKKFGSPLLETPPFSLQEPVDGMKVGSAFREAAFQLKGTDDFSDVIEDGGDYYILQLLKREESRLPEFKEVEDRVRKDLRRQKALEMARSEAKRALEEIRTRGSSLEKMAKERKWPLRTSPPLTRLFHTPLFPQKMVDAAFGLPSGKRLLPEIYAEGERVMVAEIQERVKPDPKSLEKQRGLYRAVLLRERRETLFQQWLNALRERAEIKIYPTFEELL